MDIGGKIKQYRVTKEWTQEQLGTQLNVSRSTISSWEIGRNYPDIKTLIVISDLFNVSIDSLIKEDKEMVESIDFNHRQKNKFKLSIFISSILSLTLILFIVFSHFKQPAITFKKEIITANHESEPFSREEIKDVSIKNNIVTITFQSSLKSSYYGYFADASGNDAYINLYKNKAKNDDSLKYDGVTKIDLSSLSKIKTLTVFVK